MFPWLQNFLTGILVFYLMPTSIPESAAELKNWNLEFDKDLVTYNARVLPQEKVYQKDKNVMLASCVKSTSVIPI